MHEEGFPEDQRDHYPGAIRPLVEHANVSAEARFRAPTLVHVQMGGIL